MALIGAGLATLVMVLVGLMLNWIAGVLSGLAVLLGGAAYYVQHRWFADADKKTVPANTEAERQRVQALVEEVFPCLIETSGDKIVYVAPGQEGLTGYQPAEMQGRSLKEFIHPEDLTTATTWLHGSARDEALELRLRHKSGRWVWSRVFAASRRELDGEPGFTLAAYDATREREARDALVQAQRLEGLGVLSAGIAHDFNNMLTVISGFAEILEESEARNNVLDASDAAAVLVQRLMAFGSNKAMDGEAEDVSALAQGMENVLASILGPGVRLTVTVEEDLWAPLGTPQLSQILLNLITNCREALADGGRVSLIVEGYRDDFGAQRVHIRVRDDGPGMDHQTQAKAFDPFFTTKSRGGGTGLGLASVKGLVEQVGGRVQLTTTVGKGTEVLVELPRCEPVEALPQPAETVAVVRGSGNVLVVEDDGLVADLIARSLLKAGYSVTIKNDVESAWQHLQAGLPDLLITDIMMPDGRGTELARRLRDASSDVPILFISGYSDTELGEWKDTGGRIKFLAKPFRRKELLDRVAHLVNFRSSMVS